MSVCVWPYKRQTQTQREREREREELAEEEMEQTCTAARWPRLALDVDDVAGYRG